MNLMRNSELKITLFSMIILGLTYIYDFIFRDSEKSFRIILLSITLWIMYFVYKKTFLCRCRLSFYLIYVFVMFAMYLGNVFDFYLIIPMYDKILHLLSGLIIGLIGFILFIHINNGINNKDSKSYMAVLFTLMFAISAAAIWEIWEFATDQLFGFTSQNNSLNDTMWDIICGSFMGLVMDIPIYLYIKGVKIKFIQNIVNGMKNE